MTEIQSPQNDTILVKDLSTGDFINEPFSNARLLINQGSHALASPDEAARANKYETFDTAQDKMGSFLSGAFSTSTVGLSDVGMRLVKPEYADIANEQRNVNPKSNLAGQALGYFLPDTPLAALEGGINAISKAADPFALKAAESLAPKSPYAQKLISGLMTNVPRGAATFGAIGAGQELSEEALGNQELNGQKIFSAATDSALFGGLLEGGLSAVGTGLSKLKNVSGTALKESKISDKIYEAYKSFADRSGLATKEEVQELKDIYAKSKSGDGIFKGENAYDNISNKLESNLGSADDVSKYETGKVVKDEILGTTKTKQQEFNQQYEKLRAEHGLVELPEGYTQKIVDNIEKESLSKEDKEIFKSYKDDILNAKTADSLKSVATNIQGTMYSPSYQGKFGHDVLDIVKESERNAVIDSAKLLGDKDAVKLAQNLVEDLKSIDKQYAGHFQEFQKLSDSLGLGKYKGFTKFISKLDSIEPEKLINALSKKDNFESLKLFKQISPDSFEAFKAFKKSEIKSAATSSTGFNPAKALDRIFHNEKMTPEVRSLIYSPDELKNLSEIHAEFKKIGPQETERLNTLKRQKDILSPKDSNSGKLINGFVDSTVGHTGLGAMLGAGYDILNNPAKTIKMLVQAEQIINSINSKISKGAKSLFEKVPENLTMKTAQLAYFLKDKKEEHEKIANSLQAWSNNPEKLVDYMSNATKQMTFAAPNTSQAYQITAYRAMNYLHSKIPVVPDPKPLSPKMKVSDSETNKFIKVFDTVKNPFIVYDAINTGTLTPEHVDVLKNVYPDLYEEMKVKVYDEMLNHTKQKDKHELPNSKKLGIGLFLQEDITESLSQQAIANNLANWSNPNSETDKDKSGPLTKGNRSKINAIKLAQYTASDTSKIENRNKV